MSHHSYIEVKKEGSVAKLYLNRPQQLNALHRAMVEEIVTALEHLDGDEEVRVIILLGKGKTFAAGADIDEMMEADPIQLEQLNQFAVWDRIRLIKKPLLAAVHGVALGGGFELALHCDLIFAAADARFGFPEVKLGVMPGAGGTQYLTKAVGKHRALQWLWSGEMLEATLLWQAGLIVRLFPEQELEQEVTIYAQRLASQAPLALRLIKEAVNKAQDLPLVEGMAWERKNFYLLFASQDQKEGMRAFKAKRSPRFTGR